MKREALVSFALILLIASCVDRINFDIGIKSNYPIVIDGFISDQPAPYSVSVSRSFSIDSKSVIKTPASVKAMYIIDDKGNREPFLEVTKGYYQTDSSGMRGVVGRAYKLHVELLTDQVYESKLDTLPPPGELQEVYYKFNRLEASKYAFDIYFDASQGMNSNYYFLWKFTGTFKVITNADLDPAGEPCGSERDCKECSVCNLVPKCSGLRNIGTPNDPIIVRLKPCECCTCWYNIFNERPILSDNKFLKTGNFKGIKAGTVPVHEWIFQHKVYAEVSQRSLTAKAYRFYKAIRDQKDGVNSLFQPASGKIPRNFVQISGDEEPVEGLFFATSISSKTVIITSRDVPDRIFRFPPDDPGNIIPSKCLELYPNSTLIKPSFWED